MKSYAFQLLIAFTLLACGWTVNAQPETPVQAFNKALISMMKVSSYASRVEDLAPSVEARFDLATLSRIALGRNWRSMPEASQQLVIDNMRDVIVTSYASRFPLYTNQQFEIAQTTPMGDDRATVRVQLQTADEPVTLDYQVIHKDGTWLIYDVVANGVSDLSLKRATYNEAFRDDGLSAVLGTMQSTIAKNQAQANVEP